MALIRRRSQLLAWLLYASVLYTLAACGMHHGQMSGLTLASGTLHCSTNAGNWPAAQPTPDSDTPAHLSMAFSCPLCSSFAPMVLATVFGWVLSLLVSKAARPPVIRRIAPPPPRHAWPRLNPRAPPAPSHKGFLLT